MSITIQGSKSVKPDFRGGPVSTGVDDSRKLLFELTKNIQGKAGSVKLMHTTKANRDMTLERKAWWQFGTRFKSSKMEHSVRYIEACFREGYQKSVDDIADPIEKAQMQNTLNDLIEQFNRHASRKNNKIGKNTLRTYFNKFEDHLVDKTHRLNVESSGKSKYSKNYLAINSIPFQLQKIDGGSEGVIDYYKLHTAKSLGAGAQGGVFQPQGSTDCCVKWMPPDSRNSIDIKDVISKHGLRRFDASMVYMRSEKCSKIPHVAVPTAIVVRIKKDNDSQTECYRVSLDNYSAAKKFLRKAANESGSIKIIAMEMPIVKGKEVAKIDLKEKRAVNGEVLPQVHQRENQHKLEHRQSIAKQLLEYVSSSNRAGIVDTDHKPENLLYNKDAKKLTKIDLGMQVKLSSNPNKQYRNNLWGGTISFMCPNKGMGLGPETDLFESAMTLMDIKYGGPFLQLALTRFDGYDPSTNNLKPGNKMLSTAQCPKFQNYRAQHSDRSYLYNLCSHYIASNRPYGIRYNTAKQILADLDSNNQETKFYESLFQHAWKSVPSDDTSKGRLTVYADYYKRLDKIMNDSFIK